MTVVGAVPAAQSRATSLAARPWRFWSERKDHAMGFENRDYAQDESWQNTGSRDTPATKWIVILTIVIFVLQALSVSQRTQSSALFDWLSLDAADVLQGQVWRVVTFAFVNHPLGIIGLVLSLLMIWRFGTDLERMYGTSELAFFYVSAMAFVGVTFSAFGLFLELPDPLAGSYTGALALLTLYATHFPRTEVCILPLISIQLRWLVALAALFGLYPALHMLQIGAGLVGLAYASYIGSIAFALLYRRFDWHLAAGLSLFSPATWRRTMRSRAARQQLRVFQPHGESDNLDDKVDAILAKIHEQGSDSLTDAERAILTRASEKIKNRTRS
ncbi:MAG: rhomboid family intramembrane serine protease [Candidatus Saccharimonas sp.]|nr:rhomboid family intramembrane serine protease [Planctomycetaceae bacterium]